MPRRPPALGRGGRAPGAGWLLAVGAAIALGLASGGCATDATLSSLPPVATDAAAPSTPSTGPPPAPREFRGAWVAVVANIDWPSRPGLSSDAQRAEALAILDRARAIGLNTLILQVRPAGDAIYPSALEPWSEYLTGAQGQAPSPAYDPLEFWVTQAHLRGLELEAWFNPFRARQAAARTPLVEPHLAVRRPELARRYGDQLWIDPGEPAAVAHTLAVVLDVVRRYDIDGVQIDDYFYPYPVLAGEVEVPFPDEASYARYSAAGGVLARDDWRRANVDGLVESLYREIHAAKPWLRFGVSPFGIGRPELRPPGVVGFSQYDKLYADVERWLAQGWLDDLAPQLYWPIASEGQPFATLLRYWLRADTAGRAIWPGLFSSQVGRGRSSQELLDQLSVLRTEALSAPPAPMAVQAGSDGLGAESAPAAAAPAPVSGRRAAGTAPTTAAAAGAGAPAVSMASGHIHFSINALMQDRDGLATRLRQGPYAQPALVPAMPWLEATPPPAPVLRRAGTQLLIEPAPGSAVRRWAVWRRGPGPGAPWRFSVLPAQERIIDPAGDLDLWVSAVGRSGLSSAPAAVPAPPDPPWPLVAPVPPASRAASPEPPPLHPEPHR